MQLQVTLGKAKHHFIVTPLIDQNQSLFFLIQLSDSQIMLAQREGERGKWRKAIKGQISEAMSKAIFKKIETASVYMLLEKLVSLEELKHAA